VLTGGVAFLEIDWTTVFLFIDSSLKRPTHDTICRTTDRSTTFEATVGTMVGSCVGLSYACRSVERRGWIGW
jgi:hypothetical protein